jgi:hypothetical protein
MGDQKHVLASGGIGGSGTRVAAAFLQIVGYYIGDDLNEALDNLWFTLLFKRRSILLESKTDLISLTALFFSRMSGRTNFSDQERELVFRIARQERLQHQQEWLLDRANSFLAGTGSRRANQPWGWKEPNTQIIIDRLLEIRPELRYVHFSRHPLDMAFSVNQNQLQNWGPILLNREIEIRPRHSLSFWCAAHRRVQSLVRQWPQRILTVDFDLLCSSPETEGARLAEFAGVSLSESNKSSLAGLIDRSRLRIRSISADDMAQFDPHDLSYVRELGYVL